MEIYIVIGYQTFNSTIFEQVEACKDKETADRLSLDFEKRGWEVERITAPLREVE